ncbi:MAG: helix-turn-helix domain-containing protein [Candidatus Dojkabacteria bacterium]|jgi:predicted transcriptional regulator|nr:helix-turn-helix domain-containing protein [Candidatus Dojkabacteria bacterium]
MKYSTLDTKYIGLSEEEYLVYRSILTSPPTKITSLSKELAINRTTLYEIFESLLSKKLIFKTSNPKSKVKYKAVNPRKLIQIAREYKKKTERQFEKLKREIPLLLSFSNGENLDVASELKVFKGANIRKDLDKIIGTSTEGLLGFGGNFDFDNYYQFNKRGKLQPSGQESVLRKYGDRFVFIENSEDIQKCRQFLKNNPELKELYQPRFLKRYKGNFDVDLYCFDDKIIFAYGFYKDLNSLAYLIRNQRMADSMKAFCLLLWHNATPI